MNTRTRDLLPFGRFRDEAKEREARHAIEGRFHRVIDQ
jgi:hypothetical protein